MSDRQPRFVTIINNQPQSVTQLELDHLRLDPETQYVGIVTHTLVKFQTLPLGLTGPAGPWVHGVHGHMGPCA